MNEEKRIKSIELTSIEYVLVFRFSALIQIKYNNFELKKINSIDDILLITEASSSFINRTHKWFRKKDLIATLKYLKMSI